MSLSELMPDKVIKLQKSDVFCKNVLQHIANLAIANKNSKLLHPSHLQRSSSFTIWLLNNILHVSFTVTSPSSWITVSHHPEDVIVISSSSPQDIDLSDQFIHPTAEQVLQLTSHLDHKPAKHTRSMFAMC